MIKVVASNFVKEGKLEEFIALVKVLEKATNELDEGCIAYELFQDTEHPNILTFIEEWESREALNRHIAAKHFQDVMPKLRELMEKPGDLNIYQKV